MNVSTFKPLKQQVNSNDKYTDVGYIPCNGYVPCKVSSLDIFTYEHMNTMVMVKSSASRRTRCRPAWWRRGWRELIPATTTRTGVLDQKGAGDTIIYVSDIHIILLLYWNIEV